MVPKFSKILHSSQLWVNYEGFDLWNSSSYNFTGIIGRIGVGMCRLDLFDTLIRLV